MDKGLCRRIFCVLAVNHILLRPIFSQSVQNERDFVNEFGHDFSLSMYNLKELFLQQNDGGLDIPGLIVIGISCVMLGVLGIGLLHLLKRMIGKKKRHLKEVRFQMVKKAVLKVKQDTVSDVQMESLIDKGVELSKKVDIHTGRKYSMDLPILVHRIAMQLNVGDKMAAIYFCVSFYYDAGFLDIPEELFYGEILTRKEKSKFRTHVMCFDNSIDFLPDEIYIEAYNACMFHHENCDGTGYPEGVSGNDIPLIARIIRVVESYLSLISKGPYHRGLSSKNAIKNLRSHDGVYDVSIVNILETLI